MNLSNTEDASVPIAVDAMGGDRGPEAVVDAAIGAARRLDIRLALVGDQERLKQLVGKAAPELIGDAITIHHAPDVITMEDTPSLVIRGKKQASIRVAFDLVRQGKAAAVVSTGNTGAIMAAGLVEVGALSGIARPAIASLIPKAAGLPTVLLDSGANSGCQAYQLVQFALMGRHYAISALGCSDPRIALLSNGTEMSKGNDIVRTAANMLAEVEGINFIGFVEGRDIAREGVEVVVCDGFVGNIVLKAMEGTVELVMNSMRDCVEGSLRGKLGIWLAKPILRTLFKDKLDPSAYGGAPLLGLGCVAIKCHGASSSRAIENGIRVAKKFVDEGLIGHLNTALGSLDLRVSGGDEEAVWSRVGQGFDRRRKDKVPNEGGKGE